MANVGDKVLICNGYLEENLINGTFTPKYGIVKNKYKSSDRSYHGSPWYETLTVVQGDDGKLYTDDSEQNLSRDWKKNYQFFTEKEFAEKVQHIIAKKEKEIEKKEKEVEILKTKLFLF